MLKKAREHQSILIDVNDATYAFCEGVVRTLDPAKRYGTSTGTSTSEIEGYDQGIQLFTPGT